MIMSKEYLALFDLDGTLFDTGEVNYYAYKQSLEPYGIVLKKEYFQRECNGRHYKEFLPVIMGSANHLEDVHKAKKANYATNLNKARANEHLFKLVGLMKSQYHLAIVTTASRENLIEILKYFSYDDYFEYMVTQEDITKVKPDPEGFLIAMKHFGIDAKHTIIFEDSDVGIEAARATGASVMVVNSF